MLVQQKHYQRGCHLWHCCKKANSLISRETLLNSLFKTIKADLLSMSATRMVQKKAMKLKTSLCYNPDHERLTLSIYDLKGLEVTF